MSATCPGWSQATSFTARAVEFAASLGTWRCSKVVGATSTTWAHRQKVVGTGRPSPPMARDCSCRRAQGRHRLAAARRLAVLDPSPWSDGSVTSAGAQVGRPGHQSPTAELDEGVALVGAPGPRRGRPTGRRTRSFTTVTQRNLGWPLVSWLMETAAILAQAVAAAWDASCRGWGQRDPPRGPRCRHELRRQLTRIGTCRSPTGVRRSPGVGVVWALPDPAFEGGFDGLGLA